jgi:hypothetical protein
MRRATDFRSSSCGIESKARQVGVDHVGVTPANMPVHFLDCVHRPASGTIAETRPCAYRLPFNFQQTAR